MSRSVWQSGLLDRQAMRAVVPLALVQKPARPEACRKDDPGDDNDVGDEAGEIAQGLARGLGDTESHCNHLWFCQDRLAQYIKPGPRIYSRINNMLLRQVLDQIRDHTARVKRP